MKSKKPTNQSKKPQTHRKGGQTGGYQRCWGAEGTGGGWSQVWTSKYKIRSTTWWCCAIYRKVRSSHHKEKFFSFFLFFFPFYCIYMKRWTLGWTSCGNHFIICVNQNIMLYALNSDACQLFLSKNGKTVKLNLSV